MITVAILIGNSDNKLTQQEWSDYVNSVRNIVSIYRADQYFHACSEGSEIWQNACWVVSVTHEFQEFKERLQAVGVRFRQDNIAIVIGETTFLRCTGL